MTLVLHELKERGQILHESGLHGRGQNSNYSSVFPIQ
jgi:hypothetical protein